MAEKGRGVPVDSLSDASATLQRGVVPGTSEVRVLSLQGHCGHPCGTGFTAARQRAAQAGFHPWLHSRWAPFHPRHDSLVPWLTPHSAATWFLMHSSPQYKDLPLLGQGLPGQNGELRTQANAHARTHTRGM